MILPLNYIIHDWKWERNSVVYAYFTLCGTSTSSLHNTSTTSTIQVPYMGDPVSSLLTVKLNVSDPVVTLYRVFETLLVMGLGGQGTS